MQVKKNRQIIKQPEDTTEKTDNHKITVKKFYDFIFEHKAKVDNKLFCQFKLAQNE